MSKKVKFEVRLELPEGATLADLREYIRVAVMSECGQRSPDDPLFYLNRRTVCVNRGGVVPENPDKEERWKNVPPRAKP